MKLPLSLLLAPALAASPAGPSWSDTLDRVVPGVVSIRTDAVRSFDMDSAGNMIATGFVVDAERGILLSNRHVVGPGPSRAEAVLLNHEELELQALYRDPVHDFGFYRFDPADVRFMDLVELELAPEGAVVGAEIRVVGNDAGEKLSILEGTLARLDRPAPAYGRGRFNDFNTFYFQAASSTSGGSSGSPVFDRQGRVIALNAGGSRRAASSFFLPLDRVVRALEHIQRGEPVPRGTVQTTLSHTSFDEVRRLGVSADLEAELRAARPGATGLLVVQDVVPGGPADGRLRPGDVLLAVDGAPIDTFIPMEAALDDAVGGELSVSLVRGGGRLEVVLPVQSLHDVSPSSYVEFSGGILHALSYQQARTHAVPVRGVVVAASGYALAEAGVRAGDVVLEVDGRPTPDLASLETVLAGLADNQRVSIRVFSLSDPARERVSVLRVDRRWFPMERCERDDRTGEWPCVASGEPPAPAAHAPRSATPAESRDKVARKLARSLVAVDFDAPVRTEGVYGANFRGTGVVVDAAEGLVVVDRDTVPVALGDVSITFGSTLTVPAAVRWVHPEHNLVIVQYDPSEMGDADIVSATLDPAPLEAGDTVWQVGLNQRDQLVGKQTEVSRLRAAQLPLPSPPFFREANLEVVDTESAAWTMGGVLADKKGRVRALWASFVDLSGEEPDAWFAGVPANHVLDALAHLEAGGGDWPAVGAELVPVGLAVGRDLGMDDATIRALAAADADRVVLGVARVAAGSPAATVLREGDLILRVDGARVTEPGPVEAAVRTGGATLEVLRRGEVETVTLRPWMLDAGGTRRAVGFAGALVHAPHAAVAQQRGIERSGVYVAWYWFGSPAGRYGLRPTRRIVAVDDTPTPDLDAFLAAVGDRSVGESVRLEVIDLQGRQQVITLEVDPVYWPTYELVRGDAGWRRAQ